MIPMLTQGQGGKLYYFFGGNGKKLNIMSPTFMSSTFFTVANGTARSYQAGANLTTVNVERYYFGGLNTFHPCSVSNHKPMAVYRDKVYQCLHTIMDTGGADGTYVTRFDGSGIFVLGGTTAYNARPEFSGPGIELLTASGTSSSPGLGATALLFSDVGHITYNDSLWMFGHMKARPATTDHMFTKKGWDNAGTYSVGQKNYQRKYAWMQIKDNGDGTELRRLGPWTDMGPNVSDRHHLHCCDVIGYKDDIYYANYLDVLRFPGCSGSAILIESPSGAETTKCFLNYPSGGIQNGVAQGEARLLMLTGSGLLKRVCNDKTLDMTHFRSIYDDVRTTDNWSARLDSVVDEPIRSPLLLNYNGMLHAFIPSATSGYRYFQCTGDPSGTSRWNDRTQTYLPYDLRAFDGNIFGYVDDSHMNIMFCTMGDIGVWGQTGKNKTAGATYYWRVDTDNNWATAFQGVIGLPNRGIIPYQNYGPSANIPSGSNPNYVKASDYSIIEYKLYDNFSRPCDVQIQYTADDGVTWTNCRRFKAYDGTGLLGSGITNLATSQAGTSYDFYWDHVNDIGFDVAATVRFRIRPRLRR